MSSIKLFLKQDDLCIPWKVSDDKIPELVDWLWHNEVIDGSGGDVVVEVGYEGVDCGYNLDSVEFVRFVGVLYMAGGELGRDS